MFPDKNLLVSTERRLNGCNSTLNQRHVLFLEYLRSNKECNKERLLTCCCTNVECNNNNNNNNDNDDDDDDNDSNNDNDNDNNK